MGPHDGATVPDDCLFCKITSGAIPSHKVFEDEQVLAFLDIRPLAKGHTLVVPKTHALRFEDLQPELAAHMWRIVHRITPLVTSAVGATASTIAINNGREAGQEVPHVHIHVVPRHGGDGAGPIHALFQHRPETKPEELGALAARVRADVAKPLPRRRPVA